MSMLKDGKLCCSTINAGLELEYEGVNYTTIRQDLRKIGDECWHAERDGSLRPYDHNTELKFQGPLQGNLILQALDNLSILDYHRDQITTSWRCGMHVHIDYTGISYIVAHNTYILSAMLEPILFAWGGPSRVESKFCGPTTQLAYSFAKNKGRLLDAKKYSAVNLRSIAERNTVEFRYGDITLDRARMLDYINVNMAMRIVSEQFESGWDILDSILHANSCAAWIDRHMHPLAAKELLPVAVEQEKDYSWGTIAPAVALLAEHQEDVPAMIVGRRMR